jgi:hypothetical protein
VRASAKVVSCVDIVSECAGGCFAQRRREESMLAQWRMVRGIFGLEVGGQR